MNIFKCIAVTVLFLGFLSGCKQPDAPLRLGTNIWPGYEPLYLASSINALPAEQVRLVQYASASDVIRAFRNESLELAALTLDEALILVDENIPIKIILVHDISNGADTILSRPEITRIEQIAGRRVAVESNALGAFMITRALEKAGLGLDDITIQHLPVSEHEKAYDQGKVDVVVNFEPVRTRLLKKGANEIFTSKQIHGEIVDVLVIHQRAFEQNQARLQTLVDAWFTALEYFQNEPDAASRLMASRLNLAPKEVIDSFEGLDLPGRAANIKLLRGEQAQLLTTIKALARVLADNNLISSEAVDAEILAPDFL